MAGPVRWFHESQRLRIACWAWGDEAAPPLLLLHGGRDHARSWDRIAAAFAADHYVVAPDLRGHGDSDWSQGGDYPVSGNAIDLIALAERLRGPARVICHSFGGQVAFLAAGAWPERFASIVAVEARVPAPEETPPPLTPARFREYAEGRRALEGRKPRVYPDVASAARRMRETNPRLSPEQARHLAAHGLRETDGGYVWKFDNWARHGARRDDFTHAEMRAFLAAVACPVLLVVGGEAGAKRGMARLADGFPRAHAVVVEGAGHWVQHDAPDRLIALARSHFAE